MASSEATSYIERPCDYCGVRLGSHTTTDLFMCRAQKRQFVGGFERAVPPPRETR